MKKYISLQVFLLLMVVSCGGDDDKSIAAGNVKITCDTERIDVKAVGGTATINVSSEQEWDVYSDASWIHCEAVRNAGNPDSGKVNVTVDVNNTGNKRSGEVIIKSGMSRHVVVVTQNMNLHLSESVLESASTGQTFTVYVKAAAAWTVSTSDKWITAEAVNETTVSITTEVNGEIAARTGIVAVTSDGETTTITVRQESGEVTDITVPEGYKLVWHDEFNNGSVLSSDWTHEVQPSGWVNNEQQTYVNGSADGKRVTELKDGRLNINCFKGSDGKIYSGRVYAKMNEGWTHGYFEARMLLPKGKGTWPAFWMMPVNNDYNKNPWPDCGEIDIMEEVGCVPDEISSSVHCKAYNHTINTQKTAKRNIGTAESEYHVYACEWTENMLRFYIDGEELMTFKNEGTGRDVWPFTYAFYPILNLAWGGDWGGMNGVDESALPVTLKVDYIRVFQKK